MFRRCSLHLTRSLRGRPWKNRDGKEVIHQASRPAHDADIDFDELNLSHKLISEVSLDDLQKRSGWTPPPAVVRELPFHIERSSVSQSLPVYTAYKGGGTKVVTVLRKISGDVASLVPDLEKVCDHTEVMVRPGKLVIDGNYHWRVKLWLARLGF
mgnify:CR=1 FL=1